MGKRKVLVCDDHTLMVEGLSVLLEGHPEFELAGFAHSASEAIQLLESNVPEVLLLDLNLKESDGFEVLKVARERHPALLIIILTMYRDQSLIERARKEGANAFLEKSVSNAELFTAMRRDSREPFLLSSRLQEEEQQRENFRDHFAGKMKLTKREIELICVLAKGKTTHEAAQLLFLSPYTVETHRKNIFKKLNIKSIIELVNFAHENRLC